MLQTHRLFLVVCLVVVVLAPSAQERATAQGTLEDRVYAIARGLMCPTCAGQTVAESNSPLAQQMRDEIRIRLRRGEGPEQIQAFFVAQFGQSVLATPPRHGIAWVLWMAPVAALALGALVVAAFVRKAGRSRAPRSAR
jgi:cytochrome c-type biogenesis protein CcmH